MSVDTQEVLNFPRGEHIGDLEDSGKVGVQDWDTFGSDGVRGLE